MRYPCTSATQANPEVNLDDSRLQCCIPAHKHDLAAVARARQIGFPVLSPLLGALVVWVQDGNWPVARPLAALLANAGGEVVPHIRTVLQGDDGMRKYWLLQLVVQDLGAAPRAVLHDTLHALATHPGADDRDCEVDLVAAAILARQG